MHSTKPISYSMAYTTKLAQFTSVPFLDLTLYHNIICSLQYLSFTRPNIFYIVSEVCQFMHSLTTNHWNAIKCILDYLMNTTNHGLFFAHSQLQPFSNTDQAGYTDNRCSTSDYYIFLRSNLILWSSLKQQTISHSGTKVEY